jgi:2-oxoglutarate ferredoxin oxidoreductase subunit beta
MEKFTIAKNEDIAWCPGCGNFTLLKIIQQALKELDLDPSQTVISSGIGQAAKMPQYIDLNFYNGLQEEDYQ